MSAWPPSPDASRWFPLVNVLLLGAVFAVHLNGIHGPFLLDDVGSIVENPTIRQLGSIEIWSSPPALTVSGRPVVNVSLALNYAIGRTDVRGYHLANIAIHAVAAMILFGLLRRTFGGPRLRARFGRAADALAFGAALVWSLHPLQTASVTYVVQRAEALMGLFYLLTLYCFVRAHDSRHPTSWFVAGIVACVLGMGSKEVMVSAPLAVLLYDRVFQAASWREVWRERGWWHVALAATWLVLAVVVWQADGRAGTAGFTSGVAPWDYALTQCGAVLHYLRLAVWPHPLVFDYGPYVPVSLQDGAASAVLVLALLAGVAWFCRRRAAAGFAAIVFVLVLAPSSSFVPIATEPMAEHRMYLPLAALVALGAAGLHRIAGRRAIAVMLAVGVVCGALTVRRNHTYRSARVLWATTVEAVPSNPRARSALAWALLEEGDFAGAEEQFRTVLGGRPGYIDAARGLARVLEEQGRWADAALQYENVLHAHPGDFVALSSLGQIAFGRGDLAAAAAHFERAVSSRPESAVAHNNLAGVYFELGRLSAAQAQLETALQLDPDYPEALYNLGNVRAQQNRPAEAIAAYRQALRLAPDSVEAHVNLAAVAQSVGDRTTAIHHYEEALRRRPDFQFARENLDRLLAAP